MAKAKAKKPARKRTPAIGAVVEPSLRGWSEATVIPGENIYRYPIPDSDVDAMMRRLTQWVAILTYRKAVDCANVPIRQYTSAKMGRSLEKYGWASRKVTSRKRLKYLHDPVNGPRGKAAMYAESAGEVVEVVQSEYLEILRNPNPWMSPTEFHTNMYAAQFGGGNTYLALVEDMGRMWMVNMAPQWVRAIPDEKRFIGSYVYGRNRIDPMVMDADEVMHKQNIPNLWNPYCGLSNAQAMILEVDIDSASSTRDLAMWRNGARPDSMVIFGPEAQRDQVIQQQAALNSVHQGPNNAGKFFTTNAIDIKPLQFSPREMENILRISNIQQRLFAAFQIPESVILLNTANLASGLVGNRQYARYGIKPCVDSMAEFLTVEFSRKFGFDPSDLWFAADNCVEEDLDAEADRLVKLKGAGIIAVNEARRELDLTPVDGGDELQGHDTPDKESVDDKPAKENAKEKSHQDGYRHKADGLPDQTDSVFTRLEKAVRKWLTALAGIITLTPEGFIDLKDHAASFRAVVTPFIEEIARMGVESGAASAGVDVPDISPANAAKWVENYTIRLAREVTGSMQRDLQAAISETLTSGGNLAEANAMVARALREESSYRAERIARTETSRAFQEGELLAWNELGVTTFNWQLSADPCEVCVALADKVNADGGWKVGAPILKIGEELPLPSGKTFSTTYADITTALAHPFCRCKMVPVLDPIPVNAELAGATA